jgi:hypothetical protein
VSAQSWSPSPPNQSPYNSWPLPAPQAPVHGAAVPPSTSLAPLPPLGGVQQAAAIQRPPALADRWLQPAQYEADTEQVSPYEIQLEPPGLEKLAQAVQSDESLQERIRQETRGRERRPMERSVFPPDPVLSHDTFHGRSWEPMNMEVAPYYVAYRPLYFQQINAERYGWDFGVLHPVLSATVFLKDFILWPYHFATAPCRRYEFNSGYCLPGDPVPAMLYPPELSVTGFFAEVGTILALVAIFP